jgi:phosphinothricin acetyltransferase
VILRPATPADAPAIAAIWNPIIRETTVTFTTEEKTFEGLVADIALRAALYQPFLVADHDGVLGFATYGAFRAGPGYAHVGEHTVILGPAARGQGVGRAMLGALCDHARAAGLTQMIGGISAENATALAFHARMEFAEIARLPGVGRKFGRFIDLVLLARDL